MTCSCGGKLETDALEVGRPAGRLVSRTGRGRFGRMGRFSCWVASLEVRQEDLLFSRGIVERRGGARRGEAKEAREACL